MICPILSKSGEEPSDCVAEDCAWWVNGQCAVVRIATKLLLNMP